MTERIMKRPVSSECGHDPIYPAPFPDPGASIYCYRCADWTQVSKGFRVDRRGGAEPKSHCRKGHLFTPQSTYIRGNGERECGICRYARRQREKAAYRS